MYFFNVRWYECGAVAGKVYCFLAIIDLLFLLLLNWLIPEQVSIENSRVSELPEKELKSLRCFQ
jgi:hypothetical protein